MGTMPTNPENVRRALLAAWEKKRKRGEAAPVDQDAREKKRARDARYAKRRKNNLVGTPISCEAKRENRAQLKGLDFWTRPPRRAKKIGRMAA